MDLDKNILGIDYGTSYSCVATYKDGGLVIIPNGVGERTTPSVVIFDSPDKIFIGEETLHHLPKNNTMKLYEIKRLIGKKYEEIQDLLDYFPFKIIKEENGDRPMIQMNFGESNQVTYFPEQIATLIFKKLIDNAEAFLNQKITHVLITVPADFNENQKGMVKFAAEKVEGVQVLRVINEPCAAVLAYGFPKFIIQNKFMPFNKYYSLVKNSVFHPMEEMSIISSTNLENSNNNSENSLINNEEVRNSLNNNMNNINENVIRCSLLSQDKDLMKILVFDLGGGTYDVSIVYLDKDKTFETKGYDGDQKLGGSDFDNKLIDYSLKEFCDRNNYNEKDIKKNYKCMERLKRACEETKKVLSVNFEDTIAIEDFYDNKPLSCRISRAKFEQLCDDLFKRLIKPIDKLLLKANLNNTDIDEIILVGGSSKIPKVKKIIEEKFNGIPKNDSISPDEAVAYGAIIYAESLRRLDEQFWEDINYVDKTGHSYGIEIEDGTVDVIIPKGTKYPHPYTHYFETALNYQYTFDINVYEGEKKYAYENTLIGEFTIKNIPQRPKGEVLLLVTMRIEFNQDLRVTCVVKGEEHELIIDRKNQYPNLKNSSNLSMSANNELNQLNNEEINMQQIIFEYAKDFNKQKTEKDKYDLIKKYNEAVINYLNFFENKYKDISCEKYLYLLDKLFKSYMYMFKTSVRVLIEIGEKENIKNSIELFLKKISVNAPFRIKQLLEHFKTIKNSYFEERLNIFVFSMELLYNKGIENYNKKEKNRHFYAKTLFEETLKISNSFIQNDEQSKMIPETLGKYKKIVDDSEKKIKLISAVTSLSEMEELKSQGKLFNNENKLENDNLSLLSFNLELAVKKINSINQLNQNLQALETKSFYLANIVKIEFIKNEKNMNLEHLDGLAIESISIAKKLNLNNKPWFNEIVNLKNKIESKIANVQPAPHVENINDIKKKFDELLNKGNEELLKHILDNYPYDGHKSTEESIEQYKKNKKKFLLNLKRRYGLNNVFKESILSLNKNKTNEQMNNIIIEYIGKMENKI